MPHALIHHLSRFQCHKVVRAGKIVAITEAGLMVETMPHAGITIEVSPEWFMKHQPETGGYFVVYDDGYESYSPAAAFEGGYSRVAD